MDMKWNRMDKEEFLKYIQRLDNADLEHLFYVIDMELASIDGKIAATSDYIKAAEVSGQTSDKDLADLYRRRAGLHTARMWMLWRKKATSVELNSRSQGLSDRMLRMFMAKGGEVYRQDR